MPNHIHALIPIPEPNLAGGIRHWLTGTDRVSNLVRRAERRSGKASCCPADGLKRPAVGVHDSDFQQIQGGQQIGISDGITPGKKGARG
jgi:REP element-mobilizing transposase RayT